MSVIARDERRDRRPRRDGAAPRGEDAPSCRRSRCTGAGWSGSREPRTVSILLHSFAFPLRSERRCPELPTTPERAAPRSRGRSDACGVPSAETEPRRGPRDPLAYHALHPEGSLREERMALRCSRSAPLAVTSRHEPRLPRFRAHPLGSRRPRPLLLHQRSARSELPRTRQRE